MNLKKRIEKLENEINKVLCACEVKWDEKRKNVSDWNDEDLKRYMEKPNDEIWLFWPDELDALARLKENKGLCIAPESEIIEPEIIEPEIVIELEKDETYTDIARELKIDFDEVERQINNGRIKIKTVS